MPIVVLLLVIALVAWLMLRKPAAAVPDGTEQEERLLHLCLGDRVLRERLISAELSRTPGLTRGQAVDRAYALLCRSKR
jgi:hypothetical protein